MHKIENSLKEREGHGPITQVSIINVHVFLKSCIFSLLIRKFTLSKKRKISQFKIKQILLKNLILVLAPWTLAQLNYLNHPMTKPFFTHLSGETPSLKTHDPFDSVMTGDAWVAENFILLSHNTRESLDGTKKQNGRLKTKVSEVKS